MKKITSILLALFMVVCIFPITAFAGGGIDEVDFGTELNLASSQYVTVNTDALDAYVSLDSTTDWSGPSVGFTMYLDAGVPYVFCADVYNEAASFVNRAIAVFPDDLSGDYPLAYNTVGENSTNCTVYTFFTPTVSGTYKLLVWGYAYDADDVELDGTRINVFYDVDKYNSLVDFSTELYEGELYEGEVLESDPHIDVASDINWNGYAKGFTVYLEDGVTYEFSTSVSHPNATYADRCIALFPDDAVFDYDWLDFRGNVAKEQISFSFTPDYSGDYKLLVWGYIEDGHDYLFDGSTLTVQFNELILYGVDFSTELTLGVEHKNEILKFDTFVEHPSWYGYAKGFNIDLEAGKAYSVSFRGVGNEETVAYFDRAIAIYDENNKEVFYSEAIEYSSSVELSGEYIPMNSGNYKIMFWGYCDDTNDDSLFGYENAECYYLVEETTVPTVKISNADELIAFGQDLSNGVYATIVVADIVADIDMTDREWNPIVASLENLIIFGNGHTINGLCDSLIVEISGDIIVRDLTVYSDISYLGVDETAECYGFGALVGYCGYNASFLNCNVYGSASFDGYATVDSIGSLFGYVYNDVTVNNCNVEYDIKIENTKHVDDIGGIGGYVEYVCTMDEVAWKGNITIDDKSESIYDIGGIIGTTYYDGFIENVTAEGLISMLSTESVSYNDVGGLFGYIEDYNVFNNCVSLVDINAPSANYVGGIVGMLDEENLFYNSYSCGEINAYANVGGFAGDSSCCGYNEFVNCYSISDVSGECNVGGFIGYAYEGDYIVNCYATGSVVGNDDQSVGMFLGYSSYEIHFGNVYAAIDDDFDACGLGYTYDSSNVILVDFSDDAVVSAMENYLNDTVAFIHESGTLDIELNYWKGRNVDNAPSFKEVLQYLIGDANLDGTIDSVDYLLVKRHCFKTFTLEDTALIAADVNGDGNLDSTDYLLIKRICFGTYVVA